MADPSNGGKPSASQGPTRRQRAPTITIDTSAVSPPMHDDSALPLQTLSNRPQAYPVSPYEERQDEQDSKSAHLLHSPPPVDVRSVSLFDGRDSRPTSPHNVSSPTAKWNDNHPQNFLSVPTARSRGNSVDSDEVSHSPTSYGGDTYIPSPTSSQHGETSRTSDTAHTNDYLINDKEALKADQGNEGDFEVVDNCFAFSPGQLNKLLNPKSLGAFRALGGLQGLEKGLRTDRLGGLSLDEKHLQGMVSFKEATAASEDEPPSTELNAQTVTRTTTAATSRRGADDSFFDRKRIFNDNRLPEKKAKTIFELAWLAYNDKVLILLTVAAVISLALGIYQSVSPSDGEARVEWVEGVAIMVAIIIVVVVGAANDWQKERQFVKLNKKKDSRIVKVIRSGRSQELSVYDLLVGDVMHLEPGDVIPADGIFIAGHNIRCDESSATGESDLLKKTAADEVFRAIEAHEDVGKLDPFILSGGKVTEGIGTFLITATGVNSSYGKILMSLQEGAQTTPLQSKLNVLAEHIAKLGLAAGLLLFVVTFIEFLVRLQNYPNAKEKGQAFLQVFIVAVTVVVVAVPEGLPLAVTLALAFATTRMLKDNNLVRLLRACETMGNATTICSDKTGTLTQNKMSVVAGTISTASRFGDKKGRIRPLSPTKTGQDEPENDPTDVSTTEFVSSLANEVKELMKQSIVINTTAFEGQIDGEETFIGSKTETALLKFARDHLGMASLHAERSGIDVVQLIPFDSGRKCMGTAVRMKNGKYRLYVKGASEIMLGKCYKIIRDPTSDLTETLITTENLETLNQVITNYASRSLRTIGMLYKDFDSWPPKGVPVQSDDPKLASFDKVFKDMVFFGIVGIQDPLRDGVSKAVRDCQGAGVNVRMVTGDNVLTAQAIAEECGIYKPGGLVMEGPKFRRLADVEMKQVLPRLQVLARSSPSDKKKLVEQLQAMGETVAVTGNECCQRSVKKLTISQGMAPMMHRLSKRPM